MSRRRGRVLTLVALSVAALMPGGCVKGSPHSSAHRGAGADSSFESLTSRSGRSPLEISIASGRATYIRYCAICHGETGGGDGFNAYNVRAAYGVSPTSFADSAGMAALPDSAALAAIRGGGRAVGKSAAMPPWGRTLTAVEVIEVWHYARSLAAAAHEP